MALSDEKKRGYVQRLLLSRMRLLCNHGFYGLLLMHMRYAVDEEEQTAGTDGDRIVFGTDFLDELGDAELDFVMMHEVMHVVLQHCFRGKAYDREIFNIACDIVVNSNILLECGMQPESITLQKYGESMHIAPNGEEGHKYTAEQVYEMLLSRHGARKGEGRGRLVPLPCGWDSHEAWGTAEGEGRLRDAWIKRLKDAAKAIEIRDPSNERGLLPAFVTRMLGDMGKAQTDWRALLNAFVQEEIADYSFSPPDKRYADGDFFLPDFSECDYRAENILFMVDTSASVSDGMITAAYTEIRGAIEQFNGKLKGWLGFFDAAVVDPVPFESVQELNVIRPKGGGGTRFDVIFSYVEQKMDPPPVSIVILTDGHASFPPEKAAMGIPTLWLIVDSEVNPPWGKVARLKSTKQ